MRRSIPALAVVGTIGLLSMVSALPALASTAGGAKWVVTSVSQPTNFPPAGTETLYAMKVTNVGGEPTNGPVTVEDVLPSGVEETEIDGSTEGNGDVFTGAPLTCTTVSAAERRYSCTFPGAVSPADTLKITIKVKVTAPDGALLEANRATVTGGAVSETSTSAPTTMPTSVTTEPAKFGIASFFTASSSEQAGAHPNFTTSFTLTADHGSHPAGAMKDIGVSLPAGLIGNPLAVRPCGLDDVAKATCPESSAVGVATAEIPNSGFGSTPSVELVYSVPPYPGEPAAFAFTIAGIATVRLDASVIPDAAGEYAVHVSVADVNEAESVIASTVTLWGVPAHYNGPGPDISTEGNPHVTFGGPGSELGTARSLMRTPTACRGRQASGLELDSWTEPGRIQPNGTPDLTDPRWKTAESQAPLPTAGDGFTECGLLAPLFVPSIEVAPDTSQADAPAAYSVALTASQSANPEGFATPDLKDATVTLPVGTVASPSAANGLQACSDAQLAPSSTSPAACPPASQIGTVSIKTPLLEEPLVGQVYLGAPECGPCGSAEAAEGKVLRLFLQAQYGSGTSVRIKLAGRTSIDQQTGQLTTTFKNNPQLPFSQLTLHLDGGPAAALANPTTCTTATSMSNLVPWSSTPESPLAAEPSSSFQVSGCSSPRFLPAFGAGMTSSAQADGYSPFSVRFSRADQDQALGGITVRTPPGLLGAVSHVPLCPEPQASLGTCGAGSQIGTVTVAAGPGPQPFWITDGRAYLTGPYKGGPYGLSIVVPAVAGPFNLGEEHVRAAIYIDPHTAALTIVSDPLPTRKDGIPFQLKTINVNVNRPEFMFNATNCDALGIGATISSTQGAAAEQTSPYQAVNCATLAFHPSFSASTQANGNFNGNGASLTVRIAAPGQGPQSTPSTAPEANIKKVDVQLPLEMPSRLTTLQKACTERQFSLNPAGCPPESNVGTATAHTPVLAVPLQGPAYLVSHGGAEFPDLDIILQGEGVVIDLVGNTQIKKGITYSKFETVPDAPISSFELNLPEGKYSALAAYVPHGTLCAPAKTVTVRKRVSRRVHGHLVHVLRSVKQLVPAPLLMPTTITAQNGAVLNQATKIAVTGCPKQKRPRRVTKHKKPASAHKGKPR
jgi:uncharacterized repeat protein (TIGR01451 family)